MENNSIRVVIFIMASLAILFSWNYIFPGRVQQQVPVSQPKDQFQNNLVKGQVIRVSTDMLNADVSLNGGDIRYLEFLEQGQVDDPGKPFVLLQNDDRNVYVAQTGLISPDFNLADHRTLFVSNQVEYSLKEGEDKIDVVLEAPEKEGVKVTKTITFTRGSYVIEIRYDILNNSGKDLNYQTYYRLLRDDHIPTGQSYFTNAFTGPAIYTPQEKFQKIDFEDIKSNKHKFPSETKSGWVAMLQHYFVSAWILSDKQGNTICQNGDCRPDFRRLSNGLYEASVVVPEATISDGAGVSTSAKLFSGPGETFLLEPLSEGLDLTKDYGFMTILSKPLFWVLAKINQLVGNWGWSIILLTFLIKAVLYPLSATAYRSMARMRDIAPRMHEIRANFSDDRIAMQTAMMDLYRSERVNPLGGCLPILLQMPIFLALYWMLNASVELRQAEWILWIRDLSQPDPYYILPVVLAATMVAQSFINPAPPDPVQARITKIMPILFSILFFFFPVGLVMYYIVNNTLTITQQQWVYHRVKKEPKHIKKDKKVKFAKPPTSLKEAFQMAKEQAKQRSREIAEKKKSKKNH